MEGCYSIRLAAEEDLPVIFDLYARGRQFMRQTGNQNQWTGGYPGEDLIRQDLTQQQLYVCTEQNTIAAVFCFFQGVDPTYNRIYDGHWLNDRPYGVIHRIVTAGQGRGISARCFDYGFSRCGNLKIDTHRDNLPMQRALLKNGFTRCGVIYLENGDERIAFQRA